MPRACHVAHGPSLVLTSAESSSHPSSVPLRGWSNRPRRARRPVVQVHQQGAGLPRPPARQACQVNPAVRERDRPRPAGDRAGGRLCRPLPQPGLQDICACLHAPTRAVSARLPAVCRMFIGRCKRVALACMRCVEVRHLRQHNEVGGAHPGACEAQLVQAGAPVSDLHGWQGGVCMRISCEGGHHVGASHL